MAPAKWQGWWWCPNSVSPVEQRAVYQQRGWDGPLPSLQAPFRSESSLCPCLTRVFLSFERRPFLRQIFKLKSSRTKAACQLGPSSLVPLPLQPGCHYRLMGEVCEGFRCNIWPGPLSAGETEPSDFPIWFLEIVGGASEPQSKWGEGEASPGVRPLGRLRPASFFPRLLSLLATRRLLLPTAVNSGPWEGWEPLLRTRGAEGPARRHLGSKTDFVLINSGPCPVRIS